MIDIPLEALQTPEITPRRASRQSLGEEVSNKIRTEIHRRAKISGPTLERALLEAEAQERLVSALTASGLNEQTGGRLKFKPIGVKRAFPDGSFEYEEPHIK